MTGYLKYCLNTLLLLVSSIFDITFGSASSKIAFGTESSSMEDRVKQLERIASVHGQLLIQLQQQLSDNQNEINSFRGKLQENQHILNQVAERQEKILTHIANNISNNVDIIPRQVDTDSQEQSTTSEKTVITNIEDSNYIHTRGHDITADYNEAITLAWDKSRQNDAIVAFQSFIKNYPNSTYQPNANYWLGQLFYNNGRKDDAVFYFSFVVKNYPKSSKAPDAMFKVGTILQSNGDVLNAKAIYQQILVKYPRTNSAQQAKNRLESIK